MAHDMNLFHRSWNDIRRGENIDLYLTIILALSLVALNLLGFAAEKLLAPITLAVLGLLAVTMLGNRYRLEELLEKDNKIKSSFFLEEFPASLTGDLDTASELWLVGVSLIRTIKSNYQRLERKLKQGAKIKVLLVHPEGPGVEMAASRNYAQRDSKQKISEIKTSLEYLVILQRIAPDNLQIRTIQNPLNYGVVAINPGSAAGLLYVENYCFRVSSESLPRFVLRARGRQVV